MKVFLRFFFARLFKLLLKKMGTFFVKMKKSDSKILNFYL